MPDSTIHNLPEDLSVQGTDETVVVDNSGTPNRTAHTRGNPRRH